MTILYILPYFSNHKFLYWTLSMQVDTSLSFPQVFSGNPKGINDMDARYKHSGTMTKAHFSSFEKVSSRESQIR